MEAPGGTLAAWARGLDGERLARYREYLAFYEGTQWSGRPRAGERRLTANYARTLVQKVVSYLFAEPVVQRSESVAAARALAAVSEANDLARVDLETAIDAAVLGDGAFKLGWDVARGQAWVRAVDVQALYCWWAADDRQRLERVVQVYRLAGAAGPAVVEDWRADRFTLEVDGRVTRDGPNPYPWVPYIVFPNEATPHAPWGRSDLADLMPVCQEVNQRLSVLSRILDLSGAPIAVLENVEGSEGIEVRPGARWELPAEARAYLLDLLQGGGVALHVQAIEVLYRVLHDLAETPRTAFGEGAGAVSGVALEMELQPLIQKVKRKRAIWTGVYRQRNAMLLDLLAAHGQEVGTRRTTPVWAPIAPRDRAQVVRDEVALVAAGVHSRQRAGVVLGEEEPAAEFTRVLEEAHRLAGTAGAPGGAGGGPNGG